MKRLPAWPGTNKLGPHTWMEWIVFLWEYIKFDMQELIAELKIVYVSVAARI